MVKTYNNYTETEFQTTVLYEGCLPKVVGNGGSTVVMLL